MAGKSENSTQTINRYGEREKVFVVFDLTAEVAIKYGWFARKGLKGGFGTDLGHTDVEDGAVDVIYGVNSPKPFRARRLEGTYKGLTTFCASAKLTELKTNKNWKVLPRSGIRGLVGSTKVTTVYVDMPVSLGGWKYAWNIDNTLLAKAKDSLGIKVATGADIQQLVWGGEVKPPRGTLREGDRSYQTFCEPSALQIEKALEAKWSIGGIAYEVTPKA